MTVGLIAGYQQAEEYVASGKTDLICLARGAMWDPRWAWHAAEELGAETPYAPKMMGCHPKLRPGIASEAGAAGKLRRSSTVVRAGKRACPRITSS